MFVSPPNPYVENLVPEVMVLEVGLTEGGGVIRTESSGPGLASQ